MTDLKLSRQDFVSPQMVRWCPGCGDYAVLAQMQKVLPELGIPREKFVFISGIGCSSRFPYYMNTYGIHSIHGRAPTLATGLKIANPDLSVWVITGDGDALSIGGNHFLHTLRRNININIILFNNRIYGLTKGQYSPTSLTGSKTKSSPMGAIDHPFNPISVAIGAEATFVARTIDTQVKHMADILKRAAEHKGTSFVEIYQNCVIFNDGTWDYATGRDTKDDTVVVLEEGQPLIFGKNRDKGIRLSGCLEPEVVSLDQVSPDQLLVHSERAPSSLAYMLGRMRYPEFPEPIGVFRSVERPIYEEMVHAQVNESIRLRGKGDLHQLYRSADTWEVLPEDGLEAETGNDHQAAAKTAPPVQIEEAIFDNADPALTPAPRSLAADTLAALTLPKPLIGHVDLPLSAAIDQLKTFNVDFMALVDDEGKLVGVFTTDDVLAKVACQVEDRHAKKVKDYMTTPAVSLPVNAAITLAINLMARHRLRHLPLVDDAGQPVGVISVRAIVRYLGQNFAAGPKNGR